MKEFDYRRLLSNRLKQKIKQYKNPFKRILAVLMAVLMVCSIINYSGIISVNAQTQEQTASDIASVTIDGITTYYENFADAWTAANGHIATLTLLQDFGVNISSWAQFNLTSGTVTLDFGGHTITSTFVGSNYCTLNISGGELNIRGTGGITCSNEGTPICSQGGILNVYGGSFISTTADGNCRGLISWKSSGTINIYGGIFAGYTGLRIYGDGTTVNLYGGTFTGSNRAIDAWGNNGYTVGSFLPEGYAYKQNGNYITDRAKLTVGTMEAGTVTVQQYPLKVEVGYTKETAAMVTVTSVDSAFTIVNCKLTDQSDSLKTYNTENGSFTEVAFGTYILDVTDNKNNTLTQNITVTAPVASVLIGNTTTWYEYFGDAWSAAQNAECATIKLLKNIELSRNVMLPFSKGDVVLDIGSYEMKVDTWMLFSISGGKLTINGNGTIRNVFRGGEGIVLTGGKLFINGGTFLTDMSRCIRVTGGDISISGGTFEEIHQDVSIYSDCLKSIGDFLADGCGYQKGDGSWVTDTTGNYIEGKVTIKQTPIRSLNVSTSIGEVNYGYTIPPVLTANVTTMEGVTPAYQWYKVTEDTEGKEIVSKIEGETNSTCTLETGLNAGIYTYRMIASRDGYSISADITVKVNMIKSSCSISMNGWTYGEPAAIPVSSANSDATPIYEYKLQGEADTAYSKLVPINAGIYTVRVTYPATTNYTYVDATADFTIAKADITGVSITPYTGTYDENIHNAVTINGTVPEGAAVYYSTDGGSTYSATMPTIRDKGTLSVKVKISGNNYNDLVLETRAEVSAKALTASMLQVVEDQYYTGNGVIPSVVLKDGDTTLVCGTDYIVSYFNNTAVHDSIGDNAPTITIIGKGNYTGTAEKKFTIKYYNDTIIPVYNGIITKADWYTGDVVVTASGFTVCDSLNGTYTPSYTIKGEGSIRKTLYFKQDTTSYTTDGKVIIVSIDKTAPVFSSENDGITVKANRWKSLLNTISFGIFFNDATVDVKLSATESGSGIAKYYYYLDNSGSTTAKTAEDLNGLTFNEDADGNFSIADEKQYVIYAYAVDNAGNKSAYICSDGIVLDKTAPTVELTALAAIDINDVSATAKAQMNETGTITYVYRPHSTYPFTVDEILNATNKGTLNVTAGNAGSNLELFLTDLYPNTIYYLYAVGTDNAGNNGSVVMTSFTTTKTKPTFKSYPTIMGTYGQQVRDMVVSQPTSTNGVGGTWSVLDSATATPSVDTAETFAVTFTPISPEAFATLTVQVKPTVSPRNIESAGVTVGDVLGTYSYDGTAKTPTVTVTDSSAIITAEDYEFNYLQNINAGNGTVIITGKRNYIGSIGRIFTIEQANSAINIADGKTSYLKAYGDTAFGLEGITKVGDGTLTYAVTAGNDVVSVSNGTVSILKPGTATIMVGMEATNNYKAAESKSITITVEKANAPTVTAIDRSYVTTAGSKGTTVNIDVAGLLPTDRGMTSYKLEDNTASYVENEAVDANGNLTYKVNTSGNVNDSTSLIVTAVTDNYKDITVTVNISLTDKLQVEEKTGAKVSIIGENVLTYGAKLGSLSLNTSDAVFVENGTNKVISGTLAWSMPDGTPTVGTTKAHWTFTPSDSDTYAVKTGEVSIVVEKATPIVTPPTVTGFTYNPSITLSGIILNGTNGSWTVGENSETVAGVWNWKTDTVTPIVKNSGYTAVFTPDDIVNYNTVEKVVTVKVSKALPYIVANPIAGSITYGQTLAASSLSGGSVQYSIDSEVTGYKTEVAGSFSWETAGTKPTVADSQSTEYTVVFTPADTDNYSTQTAKLKLTVKKAEIAPNAPGTVMNPSYNIKKVSEISLPENWNWKAEDQDKALIEGEEVFATAIYKGADVGNYEIESILISITRSVCTHETTEIRDEKSPTCTEAGYTGDTYCTDCGILISSGTSIPALGHTGGIATCSEKAVCTRCGQEYGELNSNNHVHTEIRNASSATCTAEGYTGDTYCVDCGVKLSSGTTIAALGHNYVSEVTKQPTTTEEGIRTYTCTRCGQTYTEVIVKLSPETGKPFIKGDNGKQGWDVIIDEIDKAGNGDYVTVDMNGTTIVPGHVIESIKGKNITAVFDLGKGITWKINGKDVISDNIGNIDFAVTTGTINIPVNIINEVTGEKYYMQISLAYDGEFGFKATLSINIESKNAGLYANLFYFNKQKGKLEFINAGRIASDGSVDLTFTHASEYTIVVSDTVMSGNNNHNPSKDTTLVKTGDNSDIKNYVWMGGLLLIIGLGIIVVKKKRETE